MVPKPAKRVKKPTSKPSEPKNRAPESTHEEVRYIKTLIEHKTPICVRLNDNEEVRGTIEYYDQAFIRLTRTDGPNLFIFKHDIKYLYELPA